jgi:hypothetical protein
MSAHAVGGKNLIRGQSRRKWKEKTDYLLPDCKNIITGVSRIHNILNLFLRKRKLRIGFKRCKP